MRLVLAADDGLHPEPAQCPRIDRRVQAVGAQHRARRQGPNLRKDLQRDPGRGVHREVDGDDVGAGERIGRQALDREVRAAHLEPGVVEPARRLREPERLAPQLVGADEDDAGHRRSPMADGIDGMATAIGMVAGGDR